MTKNEMKIQDAEWQKMKQQYQDIQGKYFQMCKKKILCNPALPIDNDVLKIVASYLLEKYHYPVEVYLNKDDNLVINKTFKYENQDSLDELEEILNHYYQIDLSTCLEIDEFREYSGSEGHIWDGNLIIDFEELPKILEREQNLFKKKQYKLRLDRKWSKYLIYKKIKKSVEEMRNVYELIDDMEVQNEFKIQTLDAFDGFLQYQTDPTDQCDILLNDLCDRYSKTKWVENIIKIFS